MSNVKKIFHLYKLMKQQWLKPDELKNLQEKQLKAIIKHAYNNSPLYHQKFRSVDLKPEDIKSIDDLKKIPFTTKKEIIQSFPDKIVPKYVNIERCFSTSTSGTTGEPFKVIYDEKDEDYEKALALRPNLSCGQNIRDKWAVFTPPTHIKEKKWFQKLRIFSPEYLSVNDLPENHLSILKEFNPDILDGYPSSILLLAKKIEEKGDYSISPKMIFTTAELLSEDMRKYIESVFETRVYDQFGCVELARTAWECEKHEGYHMDADSTIMEFVDSKENVNPGESGQIVYTGLYRYSMPFIRYITGDVGVESDESCSCGRGLPLMDVIEGRKDDFMLLPSGRIISPITWIVIMRNFDISQYQIIQTKKDLIKVLVVQNEMLNIETYKKIENDILDVLNEDITISIEIRDELPREKSGKFRSVICQLNQKDNVLGGFLK